MIYEMSQSLRKSGLCRQCPGCGHSHKIEVDTEKAMKEAKEDFNKKHKDCQNVNK